jgi:hypothetical protein
VDTVKSLQPAEDHKVILSELSLKPQLVKNVLQEYKESQKRMQHLSERKLGLGLKIFMWGLRFYVIFMVVVVAINVSQSIH